MKTMISGLIVSLCRTNSVGYFMLIQEKMLSPVSCAPHTQFKLILTSSERHDIRADHVLKFKSQKTMIASETKGCQV